MLPVLQFMYKDSAQDKCLFLTKAGLFHDVIFTWYVLPGVFSADLVWHCRDEGSANNHYSINPCAPDKLPELLTGKVSIRASHMQTDDFLKIPMILA